MKKLSILFLLAVLATPLLSAQTATGAPPFSTMQSGAFDSVDLANLNVHFSIPVVSKAGRGMPINFNLTFDSSVWYVQTSGSSKFWNFATSGWNSDPQTGYVTYQTRWSMCYDASGTKWMHGIEYWYGFTYHDQFGVAHPFPGETWASAPDVCDPPDNNPSFTSQTGDGSGYKLQVTNNYQPVVTSRSGAVVNMPLSGSGGTMLDTNGNEITESTAAGVTTITDTLGQPALSISGTTAKTYTYTAPSGGAASVTVNYSPHTVASNFSCTGVTPFGPTSVSLVSSIVLPDGGTYQFSYEQNGSNYTGRIHSVTLPTGGTITYTYSGGSNGITCSDGSAAGLTRQTPDGTWTYSRTAGTGAAWTTTVTDPQNNQTELQFQGIYQTQKKVYQGSIASGTPLETVDTCYNGSAVPCTGTAVALPITSTSVRVGYPNSTGKQNRTDTMYNTNGLPTEVDEYDFGTGGPGGLLRKTVTAYASLSNGIVNRPSSVSIYDGGGVLKAQTTFGYDESTPTVTSGTPQHITFSGSHGNLTSIHRLVSGSTTLNQSFTYYDTGNVYQATDTNGAVTTYAYETSSCGNSFPTKITLPTVNGLSMNRQMIWNCVGGVMTSQQDENGNSSSVAYTDTQFWRPSATTDAAGNTTNVTYGYVSSPGPYQVESQMNFNGGASTVDILATTDSSGRAHLTQKRQQPGGTSFDSTQVDYDGLGRPTLNYLPFQSGTGSGAGTFVGSTTLYDALGRPTSATDSGGGSVSISYTQNDVYQTVGPAPTGENAKRKQLEYDGLGRLSSVCEVTNGTGSGTCGQTTPQPGYWTKYTYNTLGNLTGVTQNAKAASGSQQNRLFSYDDLGRLLSESNPENGTTLYTYDSDTVCGTSNGDLVKRQDAVGNVTCYHYDALHRVTSITYPRGLYASVTPSKYFVYDSASISFGGTTTMANPKNRLVEAFTCTTCPATKITDLAFSYSVRGETTDVYESTPHSNGWYHVGGSYWANGALNVLSTNIAGLPTITYGADGEGRASTIAASSGQNPVSGTSYNVSSQVTDVTLGSGDSDHFSFDASTGRITQYKFTVGTTPQNVIGNLGWNANGSLGTLAITDPFNALNTQTCTYSHDDLSRSSGVSCTSWSQTFTFDPFGNIRKDGSFNFQATYTTATNQIATVTGAPPPTYDSNGNILTITDGTSHTYSWDAEGKQIGIDSLTATYDALGRMVELNSSGTYTQTIYGLGSEKLALMTGQNMQKSFIALSSGTAVYTASGLSYYRHSDWLGSSRFASTASGGMYSSSAYAPFGEQYATAGTADQNFTGQQPDSTSGLYDFLFRRLSQTQGRWISPDPAGLAAVNLANPQSWNRYSYVANSPLILVDQLGLNASYGPCGGYWWYDGYSLHCSSEDGGPGGGGDSLQPGDCADLVVNGMIVGNTCDDGPPNGPIVDPGGGQQGQNTNAANKRRNCSKGLQEAHANQDAVNRALQDWNMLQTAGGAHGIDPAMLGAIGIRETGFRNISQSGGGQGAGIFQIDLGQNPNVTAAQAFNPAWAANYAANMLSSNMGYLAAKFPNLTPSQLLQATAASYNLGRGGISGNPNTIDIGTPGNNYGSNVLLLMDCF
jgi:RHS repeat-associated protein